MDLRRIIKGEKPDLVHTTLFESNHIGRLAAIGLAPVSTSLVNTPYDKIRFGDPRISPWRLRVVQKIDAYTGRHLNAHFHAVSHAAKQGAIKDMRLPPEKITIVERGRNAIRLGKPDSNRRKEMREKLGISPVTPIIINVGRHEYQKGQKYLIEAVSLLVPKYPELVLLIAGREGTSSAQLQEIASHYGMNEVVRFLGHREDVPDLLAASDIFAFPSLYEGLPGAVIEAMALGLPIVGSDIAPMREVVERGANGILVNAASAKELAGAIEELLRDPDKRIRYGLRSREIFEQKFTLENSASRMIDLFQEIAQTAGKKQYQEYHPIFLETH